MPIIGFPDDKYVCNFPGIVFLNVFLFFREIRSASAWLKNDFILLGGGYNIILSKEYYDVDFLIFNGNFDSIEVDDIGCLIIAEAGTTILEISEIAQKYSLTGVEFYYDIPSSVGGAVVMNAGTKEGETKDILEKVRYLDLTDMTVNEKSNENLELEYRNSFFQKQYSFLIFLIHERF